MHQHLLKELMIMSCSMPLALLPVHVQNAVMHPVARAVVDFVLEAGDLLLDVLDDI